MTCLTQSASRRDNRGVAQSGSAPALGAGCRGFESLYPDQIFVFILNFNHLKIKQDNILVLFLALLIPKDTTIYISIL